MKNKYGEIVVLSIDICAKPHSALENTDMQEGVTRIEFIWRDNGVDVVTDNHSSGAATSLQSMEAHVSAFLENIRPDLMSACESACVDIECYGNDMGVAEHTGL